VVNATGIISSSNPAAEQVLEFAGWHSGDTARRWEHPPNDQADCGVPFDREDFPARRGGTYAARRGHAPPGSDDLADPAR